MTAGQVTALFGLPCPGQVIHTSELRHGRWCPLVVRVAVVVRVIWLGGGRAWVAVEGDALDAGGVAVERVLTVVEVGPALPPLQSSPGS